MNFSEFMISLLGDEFVQSLASLSLMVEDSEKFNLIISDLLEDVEEEIKSFLIEKCGHANLKVLSGKCKMEAVRYADELLSEKLSEIGNISL